MSGMNINPTNTFTSTAQVGVTNDPNWAQENGVDTSLTQQWNDVALAASIDPRNKGNEGTAADQARLDFVNSLTPAQLKENAGFTMGAGWNKSGNYTWQQVKDYSNAVQGLENKVKSLMIPGVDQSNDPTINAINDLIGGLNQNAPGALLKANQYLAAANAADTVTLSAGALSALATGSPATASLKKEHPRVLRPPTATHRLRWRSCRQANGKTHRHLSAVSPLMRVRTPLRPAKPPLGH